MIQVKAMCWSCHKTYSVAVDPEGWEKYQDGMLMRDALPELTREQREFLITKTCPTCWDDIMEETGE